MISITNPVSISRNIAPHDHTFRLTSPFCTSIIVGQFEMSYSKHFWHRIFMQTKIGQRILGEYWGFSLFIMTLHMIWKGVRPGHIGSSQCSVIITHPNANASLGGSMAAWSCSSDWHPGDPAIAVLVPWYTWQIADSAWGNADFVHWALEYNRNWLYKGYSGARVMDVPYIHTYIYTRDAIRTVYVGLAQARPNYIVHQQAYIPMLGSLQARMILQ